MRTLILGGGYTGRRVAALLAARGERVTMTSRDPASAAPPPAGVALLAYTAGSPLPGFGGARVLHSVPPGDHEPLDDLEAAPARVVYLSSAGVYGRSEVVDARTPAEPVTERQRARARAEARARAAPSALVLRPAAIYGPGRGVHEALRAGRYRLVEGADRWASRVHVDDLAALCVAALDSDLVGAFPVADAAPAPARAVAEFCVELLGLDPPPVVGADEVHETQRMRRRVDGSEVFRRLGVALRYPSYRDGIPASLTGS